ncbi:DUF1028 domain-containing protein [Boseongicola aestuarii]|uniref:DUF1028 domain-containing protein n=1 Tax=Boseongicola aestuarii TaxID=1470561 RepID=A0A238IVL6_9RHOB|nr:DUF1028 domain-containing protein [Boseongicola aestuarii]SMX22518.1 hypothetical protein BOA8489_00615 [Boseongicola aestuarii]
MTISILVRDPETGVLGGAAATGNLCVGGWVLRGDIRAGLSASQGKTPSTLWGEDVLDEMRNGRSAVQAVANVVGADQGRATRQLLAIDRNGRAAAFSGNQNVAEVSEIKSHNLVVGGNMLRDRAVIEACRTGFMVSHGPIAARLLVALEHAAAAGGDLRGLQSAAILIMSEKAPPVDLRIDYSETPLEDLGQLVARAQNATYLAWRNTLPTRQDPEI